MAVSGGASVIWKRFSGEHNRESLRRHGRPCTRARSVALVMCLAAATAGCSTSIDTYLVDPDQYSAYHCKQLVERLKELQTRESALRNLTEKASEGGGGTLIGGMSYRVEYEKAVGEERVLRRTAADKKCEVDPPALESDQVIR